MRAQSEQVTRLLQAAGAGDSRASDELLPLVYEELRRLAHHRMAGEPPGSTLQPTALVHEAYLRLVGGAEIQWNSRGHFFAAAAQAMRRILVERARRRQAVKHGGGRTLVSIEHFEPDTAELPPDEFLALDEALERLGQADARKRQVVMLRYFTGLTMGCIAQSLGVSPATVKRDWAFAKAWLYEEMNGRAGTGA